MEQICTYQQSVIDLRSALIVIASQELQNQWKEFEIQKLELPSDFKCENFDRCGDYKNTFQEKLLSTAPENRCALLKLAYAHSIVQVSTMKPTKPIESLSDFFFKELTPDVIHDRNRAMWEFRFFYGLQKKDIPETCQDTFNEINSRLNLIFDQKLKRKPLGNMLGSCGRSANAHYLNESSGTYSWETVKEPCDLINRYPEFGSEIESHCRKIKSQNATKQFIQEPLINKQEKKASPF